MSENRGILIFAEVTSTEFVHPVVFELASKADELSKKLPGEPVLALLIAKPGMIDVFREGFEKCGFDKVYVVENDKFAQYDTDLFAKTAVEVISEIKPAILLVGATTRGRDLAPRISSALQTGLTADCIELDIDEEKRLAATRPTFGGQLMATILCKTMPQMASVRPRVFKPLMIDVPKKTEIIYKNVDIENITKRVELLEFIQKAEEEISKLDYSQVVVAGGVGMKGADGFKMLEELADLLNGALGATRAAADKGFALHDIQIGQTGKTVTPKLYIACGISGAIQHIVGMRDSKKIISINIDPKAPIFEVSDVGYVGDVFEVVPKLIEKLKNNT